MRRPALAGVLALPLLLGGCPFLNTGMMTPEEHRTQAVLAVERGCSAFERMLSLMVPYRQRGELSADTVTAIDGLKSQADAWCLPDTPVPTDAYTVLARLSEMTARLGGFLEEVNR